MIQTKTKKKHLATEVVTLRKRVTELEQSETFLKKEKEIHHSVFESARGAWVIK